MVQALDPSPLDLWLDPCMGLGAFITPLLEQGVGKKRILGIDIEPLSGVSVEGATTIRGVDFFAWCTSTEQKFTKIIANPPYVAIRKLHPKLQKSLLPYGPETDRSFALRSNYWCAFLSASLRVLAQNGSLAFVLPAAWEYALYAADVRHAIYRKFESVEVHRCLEPLFPNVREGCVVLLAKGYGRTPPRAVHTDHKTSQALIAALTQGADQPQTRRLPLQLSGSAFVPFSDLYNVNIGCVTGDANYFLLTESDRRKHKLPVEALRPVLSKARHLTAARITKAEWRKLHDKDGRVWLFYPNAETLHLPAVREYIRLGESVCNLDGYKLKHRDPWYTVQDVKEKGVGFLSGMTKLGPWISFRSMRHLSATNTLYVLTPRTVMSAEERSAWALSLLSTPSRQQFCELARRYPDGLPKLEPRDLYSLRLPPPAHTNDSIQQYQRAVRLLVSDRVDEAVKIADSFIGEKAILGQPLRDKPATLKQYAGGEGTTC